MRNRNIETVPLSLSWLLPSNQSRPLKRLSEDHTKRAWYWKLIISIRYLSLSLSLLQKNVRQWHKIKSQHRSKTLYMACWSTTRWTILSSLNCSWGRRRWRIRGSRWSRITGSHSGLSGRPEFGFLSRKIWWGYQKWGFRHRGHSWWWRDALRPGRWPRDRLLRPGSMVIQGNWHGMECKFPVDTRW